MSTCTHTERYKLALNRMHNTGPSTKAYMDVHMGESRWPCMCACMQFASVSCYVCLQIHTVYKHVPIYTHRWKQFRQHVMHIYCTQSHLCTHRHKVLSWSKTYHYQLYTCNGEQTLVHVVAPMQTYSTVVVPGKYYINIWKIYILDTYMLILRKYALTPNLLWSH